MATISEVLNGNPLPNSDCARLDVELLLSHVLSCSPAYLRTWPDKTLSEQEVQLFYRLFRRRQRGEPIAYILGERSFWTLDLNVSTDTLIPRPDTEILVEQALSLDLPSAATILDLGTGTGAIALSLASERKTWQVTATDYLDKIVSLARQNAKRNGIDNIDLLCSNWFESLPKKKYDLIVSNPPYIDQDDVHLSIGDVRFEPKSALVAEKLGLADVEHIIARSREYLSANGWLMLEHGHQQATEVAARFEKCGYQNINSIQDYGGNDRVTFAQYTESNQ